MCIRDRKITESFSDLFLPIDILVEGEPFVILLAKNVLGDVLDEYNSVMNRFSRCV